MTQARAYSDNAPTAPVGSLTVITGSMFSGKTEELIRRLRRASTPAAASRSSSTPSETRSDLTEIRSHNGVPHEAGAVSTSEELLERIEPETDVVAVEEAQFFDEGIVDACRSLADSGYQVIVAGLDMDFRGRPFGPMPSLLAEADEVVKLRAICAICGRDASRSQRLIDGKPAPASAPTILVGAQETYEARCRQHHEVKHARFGLSHLRPFVSTALRAFQHLRPASRLALACQLVLGVAEVPPGRLGIRGAKEDTRTIGALAGASRLGRSPHPDLRCPQRGRILWNLFEPIPLYDEIAHFLTPFTLVAILAEIIYRNGGDDDFFNTPRRAVITGSVIGLVGAAGWEVIEVILDLMGLPISHAPPDTIFDVVLGVAGGAAGRLGRRPLPRPALQPLPHRRPPPARPLAHEITRAPVSELAGRFVYLSSVPPEPVRRSVMTLSFSLDACASIGTGLLMPRPLSPDLSRFGACALIRSLLSGLS